MTQTFTRLLLQILEWGCALVSVQSWWGCYTRDWKVFGREITVPRAEKQKNIISGTSVHPFPDELLLHGLLAVERMCHLSMSSVFPCFRVSVSPLAPVHLPNCHS